MIRQTIAAAIVVALFGAGCSFRPVYGVNAGAPDAISLAFNLAKPNSRTEQVVYEVLALRFATSTAPNTPELSVSTSASARRLGFDGAPVFVGQTYNQERGEFEDNGRRNELLRQRIDVTVNATVTLDGRTLFTTTRFASADYNTTGNVLADQAALTDAEERAAKAAAESLRLALLAKFPYNEGYLKP